MESKPGESKNVTFELGPDDFSYWDPASKSWKYDPGEFEVQVGASSRDIRLRGTVTLQ